MSYRILITLLFMVGVGRGCAANTSNTSSSNSPGKTTSAASSDAGTAPPPTGKDEEQTVKEGRATADGWPRECARPTVFCVDENGIAYSEATDPDLRPGDPLTVAVVARTPLRGALRLEANGVNPDVTTCFDLAPTPPNASAGDAGAAYLAAP